MPRKKKTQEPAEQPGLPGAAIGNEPIEEQRKIRTESFTKMLPCPLTKDERVRLGEELTESLDKVDQARKRATLVAAEAKADVERANAACDDIRERLRKGVEVRNVECTRTYDYEDAFIREERIDTGAIVLARPMTFEERQMPLIEKPVAAAPAVPSIDVRDGLVSAFYNAEEGDDEAAAVKAILDAGIKVPPELAGKTPAELATELGLDGKWTIWTETWEIRADEEEPGLPEAEDGEDAA